MTAAVTPLEARCEVCLGTGSKSQFAGGELDCVACNAATERAAMNRAIEQRKNELTGEYRLSTFSAEWFAYQLGKAAADVQDFSRHEVKLSNGITKIMEGDNIIGIKSDGFITNKDSGGILHEPLQHDSLKCGTTRADRDIERLVQAAFKKAAGGCIFGDASRLDSAQDWFSQGYRAAPVVPVAAQPVVPEGWTVTHAVPWEALTDKANIKLRYSVKRDAAPFCSEEGVRIWFGPTLESAMKSGCDALGLPYAAPSLEAQPAGEVIPADDLCALLPGPYYMDQPDGGSVTVLEQVERMAKDAARYRWLYGSSAKQFMHPIVMEQLRNPLWDTIQYIGPLTGGALDQAIDKAIAMAQGDKA